ncbi:MAG TPA: hypothetical protein VNO52_16875 [Methylomirabilota bacterium]|nr:hypothetical protein [Methylomirabilota bacterium]
MRQLRAQREALALHLLVLFDQSHHLFLQLDQPVEGRQVVAFRFGGARALS